MGLRYKKRIKKDLTEKQVCDTMDLQMEHGTIKHKGAMIMIIKKEMGLREFNTWSGATDTKDVILNNGKEDEFDDWISEMYSEGLTDTELNDILWFEDEHIYDILGIEEEEEEEEEEE